MAAPTKNFTVIPDTDIDADSPVTTGLMEDLRDNDIHLEEWVGGSHTAAIDHNHDGTNSALVSDASSPNLILNSTGDYTTYTTDRWSSNASHSTEGSIGFNNTDHAGQIVTLTAARAKALCGTGAGADFVLSCFVKETAALSTGVFVFGLADGSVDGTSFITGAKGTVDFTALSTSYKRFYFPICGITTLTTDLSFVMKATTAPTGGEFDVSGISLNLGTSLPWWMPAPNDDQAAGSFADWQGSGATDWNFWDKDVAITNATQLTPT